MEKQLDLLEKKNKTIHNTNMFIFIDGAARNNPGPAGAGIYVTYQDKTLCKEGYYLGEKTNNQAEYLALLLALFLTQEKLIKKIGFIPHLIITSDSELLVKQMTGEYRVKNPEIMKIKTIINQFLRDQSYTFKHVFREENIIADKLANRGINLKKAPPPSFLTLLANHEVAL